MSSRFRLLCLLIAVVLPSIFLSACAQGDLNELDTWDLLWISDSSGWDVAPVYARMVEEDTGKTVVVHDYWMGALAAGEIHSVLVAGEPTSKMKVALLEEEIQQAEIIVFYTNPYFSSDPDNPFDWSCETTGESYANNCGIDTFDLYIQHVEEIYAKMFQLRKNQPTIIRAYDAYAPVMETWIKYDVYDACFQCWRNYNTAIHQAAKSYNIPVAEVAQVWNGPNYAEFPAEKGYLKDALHPNESGAIAIAEAIRVLGYDPVIP